MGKKMKKLICALLASAMLVSSVGIVAFADADKDENTADLEYTQSTEAPEETEIPAATEAPEATEAPVETEAPAATEAPVASTGSAYDNDNYYQKSLALCSSLGIISGYEDGSVKPESKVTRAEMASIVLRMLAVTSWAPYQNGFTDVTSAHWAADQIQTAQESGIISGMGDGTFVPDGDVTYAQVVVMLVNAMNYQDDANYYTNDSHWASGYMKAATMSDLDLLKNAEGAMDVATDRGVVIKMVYNALLGQYKEISGYENGGVTYKANGTLAKAKFDVIDKKGVLMGTSKTSLTDKELSDNQIEIQEENVTSKTEVFDCSLKNLEEYLAQKVTYYYKQNSGRTPEVLAVSYDSSKTETYMIDDPDDIEKPENFDVNKGSIKLIGVNKAKDCTGAIIIYNGKVVTAAQKQELGTKINDLIAPDKGSVKLVDSDKDGIYDVIFVDAYETVIVSSANAEKLIAKVSDATETDIGKTVSKTFDFSGDEDRTITVTRAGTEVKLRNLKKNDVATMKRSLDNTVVDIVVTGESITGSASGITKKLGDSKATINDTRYEVADIAVGDLKTGTQATFYFDMFDRIAYIDGASSGRLESGEKYGWLMSDGYMSENGESYIIKIMTQDGKAEEYEFANTVTYWAPKDTSGSQELSKSAMERTYKDLMSDISGNFPAIWYESDRNKDGNATYPPSVYSSDPGQRRVQYKALAPITLVKYKANSSGKITKFYCPVNVTNNSPRFYDPDYVAGWDTATKNAIEADGVNMDDFGWAIDGSKAGEVWHGITEPYLTKKQIADLKDSDALIIDATNKSGSTLVGGLVGGYVITDGITEFQIPNAVADYKDAGAYTVKKVNASEYNLKENGLADTYFIADQDGTSPGAIVRFVANPDNPVNPADLDNVGVTTAMVVDEIGILYDDDDNMIYTIDGYSGGTKVSITTKKTSALAELTGYYNDRSYVTTGGTSIVSWGGNGTVWTGDSTVSLTNYIHKGDIIITDGTYILIYASAQDMYEALKADPTATLSKTVAGSGTRNYFWFAPVIDSDIGDTPWISVGGNLLSTDVSTAMDIVEIDLSKNSASAAITVSDDVATIADVEKFESSDEEYDYVFANFASKGSLQKAIVYRIKPAN